MLKRLSSGQIYLLLGVLLVVSVVASAGIGANSFTPAQMIRYVGQAFGWIPTPAADRIPHNVFVLLRLPRVAMAGLTGAVLGVAGALMQGMFRNPIVAPGLVGTSAGAAFGAALYIVLGDRLAQGLFAHLGLLGEPLLAFVCSFIATLVVYRIAASFDKVNVFTLLLGGIAINAICNAGTGFLSLIATNPQARDITFWMLGSFTTANWHDAILVAVVFAVCFAWVLRHGKSLNALMLGEDEAAYLGVNPGRLIMVLLVINTIMVAVATSTVGVIAFIGLVIPHVLRMLKSADYTFLLPASALLGAVAMEVIDIAARLVIQPAELPIGIITAIIGAPIFIWILVSQQRKGIAGFHG